MKVGSAEPGTSVTVTLWIERRVNVGESALFDVDAALGCEQRPVTGQSGWKDAIKQVDPARDTHPDIFG